MAKSYANLLSLTGRKGNMLSIHVYLYESATNSIGRMCSGDVFGILQEIQRTDLFVRLH